MCIHLMDKRYSMASIKIKGMKWAKLFGLLPKKTITKSSILE